MIKYEREENGVKVSLEIDNEAFTSIDVIEIIEKINTTVEVQEIKTNSLFERPTKNEEEGY